MIAVEMLRLQDQAEMYQVQRETMEDLRASINEEVETYEQECWSWVSTLCNSDLQSEYINRKSHMEKDQCFHTKVLSMLSERIEVLRGIEERMKERRTNLEKCWTALGYRLDEMEAEKGTVDEEDIRIMLKDPACSRCGAEIWMKHSNVVMKGGEIVVSDEGVPICSSDDSHEIIYPDMLGFEVEDFNIRESNNK